MPTNFLGDKESCLPIIGLIATLPTRDTLTRVAVPSIANQARQLDALVIVSDNTTLPAGVVQTLGKLMPRTPVHLLSNARASGAANTWNTGIKHIANHWPQAYVAILDDDDQWNPEHLKICENTARATGWPDVVVSGLRVSINGEEVPRNPPLSFCMDEFLIGNPGWQGSNTFIRLKTLIEAGLFTEGLISCNDRDLAIRVLSLKAARFAFTGRHTASWHLDTGRSSLSSKGSTAKRAGLTKFFELHGHRMNEVVRNSFFERADKLFGCSENEILAGTGITADA
jgi:glycosyltransferase involved in cell wall biosynthesis